MRDALGPASAQVARSCLTRSKRRCSTLPSSSASSTTPSRPTRRTSATQQECDRIAVEVTNLTKAIAQGGDIPALAEALKSRDARLRELERELARPVMMQDRETLKAALELRSADWRGVLRGPHILQARQVLKHVMDLPIKILNEPVPAVTVPVGGFRLSGLGGDMTMLEVTALQSFFPSQRSLLFSYG